MSAIVYDFATKKVLDCGESINEQQAKAIEEEAAFDTESCSKAIAEILNVLRKEGYNTSETVVVVPDMGKGNPATLCLGEQVDIGNMIKVVGDSYKHLVKVRRRGLPDGENDDPA
jgi:hypothetical protein